MILATNVEMKDDLNQNHNIEPHWNCIEKVRFASVKMNLNVNMNMNIQISLNMKMNIIMKYSCNQCRNE